MMNGWIAAGLVFLGASILGGLAMQGADLGQWPWFIARASGIAAFVVLSLSVMCGLLLSGRAGGRPLPKLCQFELHSFLGVFSLALLAVHAGALLFDGFFHFTPLSVLVPFTSPYRPLWTGLGVIAGWTSAAIAASALVRRQIGYAAWRRLHYLSFLAYVAALVHGVTSGTDTGAPLVTGLYAASALGVAGLLAYRLRRRAPSAAARREGPRAPAAARERPRFVR